MARSDREGLRQLPESSSRRHGPDPASTPGMHANALVLGVLAALPACFDGGGPSGPLSPGPPPGVEFRGARTTNDWFAPDVGWTAVGGVQTIALVDARTLGPIDEPWRAELEGALTVERQRDDRVVVTAAAAGEADLRIVDDATGAVRDAYTLYARHATTVSLLSGAELVRSGPSLVWFAGADIDAALHLHGDEPSRLVDEQLTVSLAEPAA